ILLLTVPPAIAHLLTEEPVHDALNVLAEVGPERNDLPVDAGLHLAGEEGLAIVLPPAVLADQEDGAARAGAGGIETEVSEQHQAPGGGRPLGEQRSLALRWE